MEAALLWGLGAVGAIQAGSSPPLDLLMRLAGALGSGPALAAIAAFVYWCADGKKGLRLGAAALVSAWVNAALKLLLDQPRPFFEGFDPSAGMVSAAMGGLPSWHAQNALVVFFIVASWGKSRLLFVPAALLCLLVAFSRVYLGANFPTDILGGWAVGGTLLCAYFLAGRRIEALFSGRPPRAALLAIAALSFAMILYRPSWETIPPAGMLLGMGLGFYLCGRYVGFAAPSPVGGPAGRLVPLARFAIGFGGAALLFVLSGNLLGGLRHAENYHLFVFARFALLALWISAGAPWVFAAARLAGSGAGPRGEGG